MLIVMFKPTSADPAGKFRSRLGQGGYGRDLDLDLDFTSFPFLVRM